MLNFEKLKNALFELVESKVELKKVEIQEKIESRFADISFQLIKAGLIFMVIIFISILAAIGLNQLMDSFFYGYLIIFCVYLITLIIFISNKKFFKQIIAEKIGEKVEQRKSKKSN